jgi:hypothetical protein
MTRGLQADGWTTPGRPATIRVYGGNRRELVDLGVGLRAPASRSSAYRLTTRGQGRTGILDPGTSKTELMRLCLPARSVADLTLTSPSSTQIEGLQLSPVVDETRAVGVGVGPISARRLGEC